jgi:hypothetical protein
MRRSWSAGFMSISFDGVLQRGPVVWVNHKRMALEFRRRAGELAED